MEKDDTLKKRYVVGSIALILFLILMMCDILSVEDSENDQTLVNQHSVIKEKEQEGRDIIARNVLNHPRAAGIHAKSITFIGIGFIGIGYGLLIKEERQKRKEEKTNTMPYEEWHKEDKEMNAYF